LDEMVIVAGLGIDAGPDGKGVLVTAQIASPSSSRGSSDPPSGGQAAGPKSPQTETAHGATIPDAVVRGLYRTLTHRVFLAHAGVVVIGEQAARAGISGILDFLSRHEEVRENAWIVVARSDAASVLNTPVSREAVAATGLVSMIRNQIRVGGSRSSQIHIMQEQISDKTRAATTGIVEVKQEGPPGLIVSGTAVFKQDKLVGELDQTATRGLMWAIGEVSGGALTVKCMCGKDADLLVDGAKGSVYGEMKNGRPHMVIRVSISSTLDGLNCSEDLTEPGVMEFLNAQQSRLVEAEITAALDRARELNADIFGFGGAIREHYRGDWKLVEEQWSTLFPTFDVEIRVYAELYHTGLKSRSTLGGQ